MAELELEILRALELRLLRCSLSPAKNNDSQTLIQQNPLIRLTEDVVSLIEKGDYMGALSSDAVPLVFSFADSWEFQDSIDGADRFYCEVEKSITSFLQNDSEAWLSVLESEYDSDHLWRAFLVLCLGVAAFLAFTQCNVTGPVGEFPMFPLLFPGLKDGKIVKYGVEWEMWARSQLMSCGSDLLGKFSLPQYMVYAKTLLIKTKDFLLERKSSSFSGIKTISWWLTRIILLQQRILDERSSSLYDLLQVLISDILHHFGNLDRVTGYWGTKLCYGEASTIVSLAHLEAGVIELTYGRVDPSRLFFNEAEEASGLQLSVTGVLGFRTVHQAVAKAQMVLVANSNEQKNISKTISSSNPTLRGCNSTVGEDKMVSHSLEQYNDCEILMTPKLVENGKDAGVDPIVIHNGGDAKMSLDAIQQAVILAQCLFIKKSGPDDELQRWEMAPFIEAIDAQPFSYFIIRCFCDILRIRWESTRSRTKQRALLMMDKLVQSIYEAFPGAAQRIQFSYGVYVPTIPALRKEYGELLVGCGMIGDALKIFEDLELWDNLIYCYRLLEKKAAAVDLIKARLCKMPNDPRLWCSLGDVTNNDAYYEKALEVSNKRSSRAKRSLARSAYNRGDYETSKILWESAMAINSLYPDGWFALGAAALKARDIDKALDGFARAVQLDPDNGEAWNNIACLHMINKKSKKAFIAFKEALKFRRSSWQMWENYSQVAMDINNFSQALEATKMVLDMTKNKRIDTALLERVMVEMEARTSMPTLLPSAALGDHHCSMQASPGDSRETEHLMALLGEVLQQIVRNGGGGDIWGLYARWHKIKGDLTMCSEALLKQVRSYQGSDLWHNQDRFKKFARASLQLCKLYMEMASSTGNHRELTTAEMHLRNTVKQAERFTDTEAFRDLQVCLDEVKKRLQVAETENA
ncbi:uncharacterized protein LOC143887041 [Tasmannia lanceolata]|uniref:uncharacterized protein LOC143887041 n=1 Tax=Tasmannia lanceolata TaxID=3420 RepID=UPI00406306CB